MAKMEKINLSEVSLVDHPAHMVEGFAVIKSDDPDKNRAVFAALRKETMAEQTLADVLKDASADDIRAALSPEQLAALTPEVEKAAEPVEDDDFMKSLPEDSPIRAEFEKRDAEIAKAQADAAAAREEADIAKAQRLDEAAIQKSKDEHKNLAFAHETVAPALRKFAESNPEAAESIATMLKAVNAQVDGALFDELGTSHPGDIDDSAEARLNALAKARAEAESEPFAKAYTAVVQDPANADLVTAYFKENA